MANKITTTIENVYKKDSPDRLEFDLQVNQWRQHVKHDIPYQRKKWYRFGTYMLKFQDDCKDAGLSVSQTVTLLEKHFVGFDSRRYRSDLKYYVENFDAIIEHAEKVKSVSVSPIRLSNIYRTAQKKEREAKTEDAKTEEAKTEVKTVKGGREKVQGTKDLQRHVEPARQGKSSPMTVKEAIQVFHRASNSIISFDNDMKFKPEHKKEILRIAYNLITHLTTDEDETDNEVPDDTEYDPIDNVINSVFKTQLAMNS